MALWQNQGVVHLVDANGVALQPVDAQNWPDLPLIVGPDANLQAKALLTLLDAAPALKAEMTDAVWRSEEHTSELQSLMRISYAVFCLKKKTTKSLYKDKRITTKQTKELQ